MPQQRDDHHFIDRNLRATRVTLTGPYSVTLTPVPLSHEILVVTIPAQPEGFPVPSTQILPPDPLRVSAQVQTDSNALFLLSGPQVVPNVTTDGYVMIYGWSGFSPFLISSNEAVHVAQAPGTATAATVRIWIEKRSDG